MPGISINSPLAAGSPFSDLERELNHYELATSPRGCLVTIRNNTTTDREALIVAAGVQFSYYEGTAAGAASHEYMAGPVHVEVGPGVAVPFRFSDPRRAVYRVRVGVRVMFGNPNGFPSTTFDNYFWENTLPPLPLIAPAPLYQRIGELHIDLRLKREAAVSPPTVLIIPPVGGHFPPIPGPLARPAGAVDWFELAERPR